MSVPPHYIGLPKDEVAIFLLTLTFKKAIYSFVVQYSWTHPVSAQAFNFVLAFPFLSKSNLRGILPSLPQGYWMHRQRAVHPPQARNRSHLPCALQIFFFMALYNCRLKGDNRLLLCQFLKCASVCYHKYCGSKAK